MQQAMTTTEFIGVVAKNFLQTFSSLITIVLSNNKHRPDLHDIFCGKRDTRQKLGNSLIKNHTMSISCLPSVRHFDIFVQSNKWSSG